MLNFQEQARTGRHRTMCLEKNLVKIQMSEYLCFGSAFVWAILRILYKSKPKSGLFLWISNNRACRMPVNGTYLIQIQILTLLV